MTKMPMGWMACFTHGVDTKDSKMQRLMGRLHATHGRDNTSSKMETPHGVDKRTTHGDDKQDPENERPMGMTICITHGVH